MHTHTIHQKNPPNPRLRTATSIVALILITAITALAAIGCGASDEGVVDQDVEVERPTAMPAAEAAPAAVAREIESSNASNDAMMMSEDEATESTSEATSPDRQFNIAAQQTSRIIVHNAEMEIEAANPPDALSAIQDIALGNRGWVVESNTDQSARINITIRVPAQSLDDAIDRITRIASKVITSNITSTDFTEEYIDLNARIQIISDTVDALRALLQDATIARNLDEVLKVQQEINNYESQRESLQGRLRFISESAAFSRITIYIKPSPMPMKVDAGGNKRTALGISSQFTAKFYPPEGFNQFQIEWDFGDATSIQTIRRALRSADADGAYISVPVVHTYFDEKYSPYAVTVKVTASSDNKVAQGEDELWAHASELPSLNLYVEDGIQAEENEEVQFRATFNDHVEVGTLNYEWNFNDGSAPQRGIIPDGTSESTTTHSFEHSRYQVYDVSFEIWGDSDAGEVREKGSLFVSVVEPAVVNPSVFEPRNAAANAANVVVTVASYAGNVAVWIAVTSPIWLVIAAVLYGIIWISRYLDRRNRSKRLQSMQQAQELKKQNRDQQEQAKDQDQQLSENQDQEETSPKQPRPKIEVIRPD